MSNLNLYRIEKDRIRENLNKYTRKAFELLPKLKNSNILDIGCGTGVPTMESAKISDGTVIGIDIDVNIILPSNGLLKSSGISLITTPILLMKLKKTGLKLKNIGQIS